MPQKAAKHTYQPSTEKIYERYFLKFSKGGTANLHEDDLGLLDPDGEAAEAEEVFVQAQ